MRGFLLLSGLFAVKQGSMQGCGVEAVSDGVYEIIMPRTAVDS